MPKHRCAAGLASSEPAIPYVVTRDVLECYTHGYHSSNHSVNDFQVCSGNWARRGTGSVSGKTTWR